jgi:hypothetical protein
MNYGQYWIHLQKKTFFIANFHVLGLLKYLKNYFTAKKNPSVTWRCVRSMVKISIDDISAKG